LPLVFLQDSTNPINLPITLLRSVVGLLSMTEIYAIIDKGSGLRW